MNQEFTQFLRTCPIPKQTKVVALVLKRGVGPLGTGVVMTLSMTDEQAGITVAVWGEWCDLDQGSIGTSVEVVSVAQQLSAADVEAIVRPGELFGRWVDSDLDKLGRR